MTILIVGLIVFLAIHATRIVAPAWRDKQIAALGDDKWKGIYSLVSIVGFVLLVWGYGLARDDALELYDPIAGARGASFLAIPLALILLFASQFPAGYIKRIVRHPMLWGVIIWAIIHLMNNGDAASVLLFGAFGVWAIINIVSCYARPYSAPDTVKIWPDVAAVVISVVLSWLLLRFLHEWAFGVALV